MSRIFVAGSINMDVVATARKHPSVGETVIGTSLQFIPGGKGANQAVAAAKLGAPTTLIGRVGSDAFAEPLLKFLRESGVTLEVKGEPEFSTGTALIVVASGDNSIVVVPGANFALGPQSVKPNNISRGDFCVAQFEIPKETIISFFAHSKKHGATTILNPAPANEIGSELRELTDIIVLNETELTSLTNSQVDVEDEESLKLAAGVLRGNSKLGVIVTIGRKGAIGYFNGEQYVAQGYKIDAVDSTGAGDCFVGAFVAALANNESTKQALELANAAAAISVTRKGAGPSMPSMAEVKKFRR